ncbi:acyl-CoA dehydrogenase family protein [Streptomyces goshikiensis]
MARLAQTAGLTDVQREILKTVREFVDKEIIPVATELEHRDEYPQQIVDGLKELGLFGLMIPEEYGGLGESLLTYALCVEEIARGWMSVSGIINTHFIVAYMLKQHGTQEQRDHFLPRMALGEVRGAFSMSEPALGSDVSAITSKAVKDGDEYVLNGQKMWLTNGGSSTLVAVLVRSDEGHPEGTAPHKSMTTFLVEKEPGFGEVRPGLTIPGKIDKMGYKGVDTTELIMDGLRIPANRVLGGQTGRGFLPNDGRGRGRPRERGRPWLWRRSACFRAGCLLCPATSHFRQGDRRAPGNPVQAGRDGYQGRSRPCDDGQCSTQKKDSGERNDLEAGMAKYLASEYCKEVVEDAFRIHGGYGFSKEYEIERLYREAPMLLIGEDTAEIQKMIIGRRLLEEYRLQG